MDLHAVAAGVDGPSGGTANVRCDSGGRGSLAGTMPTSWSAEGRESARKVQIASQEGRERWAR